MKKTKIFIVLFIVLALLSACSANAAEVAEEVVEEVAEEEAALTVGEKAYSQSDLEAFESMDVDYTGKDSETTTYTGVLLSSLLEDAGVSDGENVTFVSSDGYEAEITMAEVLVCTNCIVAFDEDSLRTVLPDFGGKVNVKDVVEIGVE